MADQFISYGGGGGSGGGSSVTWTNEAVSGVVNGVNTTFTITSAPTDVGTLELFLDGLLQYPGALLDYTLTGSTITMTVAPNFGQTLWAIYRSA